jgi:type II secretory pathway pseudopilin PulG
MMRVKRQGNRGESGFTLVEYLVCFMIGTFSITTIATGYVIASQRTAYLTASAVAQRVAKERMEEVCRARWDLYCNPPINDIPSMAGTYAVSLRLLQAGADDVVPATVTTAVTALGGGPPLQMIRVDCVWSYMGRGPYTNTVVTFRAPRT